MTSFLGIEESVMLAGQVCNLFHKTLAGQVCNLPGQDAILSNSTTVHSAALLADSPSSFFSEFPGLALVAAASRIDSSRVLVWLLVAAGGVALVVGGLAFAARAMHRRRVNSHPGLFAGLCQHHKLDRTSRSLLKALGQAHRVRYAAQVFLDPTLFEPQSLPPALRSRKEEILALRQQLFLV